MIPLVTNFKDYEWLLFGGGALLAIVLILFCGGGKYARAYLWIVALLNGLISFILLLILELDNPFTGTLHITPAAFQLALDTIDKLQ